MRLKGARIISIFTVLCFVVTLNVFTAANPAHGTQQGMNIVVPDPLKTGDKVAIAAPARSAANLTSERFEAIVEFLTEKSFDVVISDDMFIETPLDVGDGTEEIRAAAFNKLVRDPEIKAIFCIRGGYASMHLLPLLDYAAMRENRPIIVGYSDITAMQTAILQNAGLITFHGPMLSSNYGQDESFDLLFDMLMNKLEEPLTSFPLENIDGTEFSVINEGVAEGVIAGGNMTLISALMGTPYEIDLREKILFIEELEEPPYRLHSYIWQLKLTGKLDQVAAIVVGDILPKNGIHLQVILEALRTVNVPILHGVRAGHDGNPFTIPIGATVRIEGNKMSVIRLGTEEPIEVSIVDGKVEIRNNTDEFFSTKGYYLTDDTSEWVLPVVLIRAGETVTIGGGKRVRIDLTDVDEVWLVLESKNLSS